MHGIAAQDDRDLSVVVDDEHFRVERAVGGLQSNHLFLRVVVVGSRTEVFTNRPNYTETMDSSSLSL